MDELKDLAEAFDNVKEEGKKALFKCNCKIVANIITTFIYLASVASMVMLLLGYTNIVFYIVPFVIAVIFLITNLVLLIKAISIRGTVKRGMYLGNALYDIFIKEEHEDGESD